jgi:hypothetical protein
MKNSITIKQSVFINQPKSVVWNYTQNYSNRPVWDSSVLSATVLHTTPNRMVRLKLKGNTSMTFVYKLDDRPNKTSLKAIDIDSPYIIAAGGSWIYEEQNGITKWMRADTIVLKDSLLMGLSIWLLKLILNFQTRKAMKKVKRILEEEE